MKAETTQRANWGSKRLTFLARPAFTKRGRGGGKQGGGHSGSRKLGEIRPNSGGGFAGRCAIIRNRQVGKGRRLKERKNSGTVNGVTEDIGKKSAGKKGEVRREIREEKRNI